MLKKQNNMPRHMFQNLGTFKCFMISFISKYKNYQRYQKHDIFQSLRPNSSSVTKIELHWCPIRQNWEKFGRFQAISRVPEISWKFPGMMKFWNSVLKIKFLIKNWVGNIPCMLKSVTSQFQGISGILGSKSKNY